MSFAHRPRSTSRPREFKHELTFDAWADEKEAVAAEASAKARSSTLSHTHTREKRAKASSAAFNAWLEDKSVHERTLVLLEKLSTTHAKNAEGWKEVGLALAHTHAYTQECRDAADEDTRAATAAVDAASKRRSALAAFLSWTKRNYGFDEAVVPPEMLKGFSKSARALMEKRADDAYVIVGLTFQAPSKAPKPGEVARMPSKDDQLRNELFVTLTRNAFKTLVAQAVAGVNEATGTLPLARPAVGLRGAAGGGPERTAEERATILSKRKKAFVARGLHRLAAMIEADRRKKEDDERGERNEKRESAKHAHARWLRTKDTLRIRLPTAEEAARFRERECPRGRSTVDQQHATRRTACAATRPRFDFSVGSSSGRAPLSVPPLSTNTADVIRRSGMTIKYAHATGTMGGQSKDFEQSKRALASQGFVYRENFRDVEAGTLDEAGEDAFREAIMAAGRRAKRRDDEAFDKWLAVKEGADLAREVLLLMPLASAARTDADDVEAESGPSRDQIALWRAVGYACKIIDRPLLSDWMDWSDPFFSREECMRAWDGFGRARRSARGSSPTSESKARSKSPTASGEFPASDLDAAVSLLRQLSAEYRKAAELREASQKEPAPATPVLLRAPDAECLPLFLHGHEEVIRNVSHELGIQDGRGVRMFHGTGVGAEIVLQWSCSAAQRQPPYAVVLETCGLAGGAQQRKGEWTRVLIDPPAPMSILSAPPGTTYVPGAPAEQAFRFSPQDAPTTDAFGDDAEIPRQLRGCVRLTGLLPNKTYCYRVRAYSRVGASSYTFGVFTTAAAPPSAPVLATPSAVPLRLLSSADGAEQRSAAAIPAASTNALRMCWDRRVGRRALLLRLLRVYQSAVSETQVLREAEIAETGTLDGDLAAVGAGQAEWSVLMRALNREAGLREALMLSIASVDAWPMKAEYVPDSSTMLNNLGVVAREPIHVWTALQQLKVTAVVLDDLLQLVARDDTDGAVDDVDLILSASGDGGGASPRSVAGSVRGSRSRPLDSARSTTRERPASARSVARGDADTFASNSLTTMLAARSSGADTSTKQCLFQCTSDGPLGQQWQEIFVGVRTLRAVDKLLPGTAYCFRAQIVNAEGVASRYGPSAVISTALPSVSGLALVGSATPTSAVLRWNAIVGNNALAAARAAAGGAPPSPVSPRSGAADGAIQSRPARPPAQIDAVLDAILKRGKERSLAQPPRPTRTSRPSSARPALGAGTMPRVTEPAGTPGSPPQEGDGGVGVDLHRMWSKYDVDNTGYLERAELRGLLQDLGAFQEALAPDAAAALVVGGTAAPGAHELAANSGPPIASDEARLSIAIQLMDPDDAGRISFATFADWWNGVDAARAAAAAHVRAAAQRRRRDRSTARSASPSAASTHSGRSSRRHRASMGTAAAKTNEDRDEAADDDSEDETGGEDLRTSTILYAIQCRRRLREFDTLGPLPSDRRPSGSVARTEHSLHSAATPSGGDRSTGKTVYTPWESVALTASNTFRVDDMLPKTEYQFRVTAVGRHASAPPCKPFGMETPPLAPFAPVLVRSGPRWLAVRWYPGELGAAKFIVQAKRVDALLPTKATVHGASATGRSVAPRAAYYTGRNVTELRGRHMMTRLPADEMSVEHEDVELWQEDIHGGEWQTMYTGPYTYTVLAGLVTNTVYRLRVISVNTRGNQSRPSPEAQAITLDTVEHDRLKPSTAAAHFVVEVNKFYVPPAAVEDMPGERMLVADVVVGDTICYTESIFVDGDPAALPARTAIALPIVDALHPRARLLGTRTVAATVLADSASRAAAASAPTKVDGIDGARMPDDAASARHSTLVPAEGAPAFAAPLDLAPPEQSALTAACKQRVLSLQVEWCTVGPVLDHDADAISPMKYSTGLIIKRATASLAHLDVYRMRWEDESGRWSLQEELAASFEEEV